jgi:polyisoprenoid-binding protein YceI
MLNRFVTVSLVFVLFLTSFAAAPREYKIDNNHSTVGFSVPILGGLSQVTGKFSNFDINLQADEKDITRSTVRAVIKTASIDTGIDARDNHLRTGDFFDAEKFPEIIFQSTSVKKRGKGFVAIGDLTMHGVTKPVELPFTITGTVKKDGMTTVGYRAHLTLNRRDYGINYTNKTTPNFIGDMIDVDIELITKAIKDQP